jgi:hypothetical protein
MMNVALNTNNSLFLFSTEFFSYHSSQLSRFRSAIYRTKAIGKSRVNPLLSLDRGTKSAELWRVGQKDIIADINEHQQYNIKYIFTTYKYI